MKKEVKKSSYFLLETGLKNISLLKAIFYQRDFSSRFTSRFTSLFVSSKYFQMNPEIEFIWKEKVLNERKATGIYQERSLLLEKELEIYRKENYLLKQRIATSDNV